MAIAKCLRLHAPSSHFYPQITQIFLHLKSTHIFNLENKMKKYFVLLYLMLPLAAHAGAVEKLKTFIAATHSAQANFTQEVLDQNGKRIQSASGIMQFQRPGKFRWSYQKPYEQLIIGDGAKFWLYDVDLNQVTVKKLDAALGSSPEALLSGSNEIERGFTLAENGSKDNLEWLQATPKGQGKNQDSSFNKILMAFNAQSELVVMELNDMFGHKTVLHFSAMQRNPKIPEQQFRFTPPKGADVISD
jgi:outer membrane lipoprotein carrier protein